MDYQHHKSGDVVFVLSLKRVFGIHTTRFLLVATGTCNERTFRPSAYLARRSGRVYRCSTVVYVVCEKKTNYFRKDYVVYIGVRVENRVTPVYVRVCDVDKRQ